MTHSDLQTHTPQPALTRTTVRQLEAGARRHWKNGTMAALRLAVELCQLQSAGAHRLRGFDNFGVYASQQCPGLSAAMAKNLAWVGATILKLEESGRLRSAEAHGAVGTTGARALGSVAANHGDVIMLSVFDHAVEDKPGRPLSERDVRVAARAVLSAATPEPPHPPVSATDRPYVSAEEEVVAVDELSNVLHLMNGDIDELLNADWEEELTDDKRVELLYEVNRLRARLDRFSTRVSP